MAQPADGIHHTQSPPSDGAPPVDRTPPRRVYPLWTIGLLGAAALFLVWHVSIALLLIFGGLLFGVFLDACCRGLERVLPLGRAWVLTIVLVVLTILVSAALVLGGYNLVMQLDEFIDMLEAQIVAWSDELAAIGLDTETVEQDGGGAFAGMLPSPADLFERARTALTAITGTIGDIFLIIFVGLFAAAQPGYYVRGVQKLVPRRMERRVGEVMGEAGLALRWWLVGQLAAMILIGVTTWAAMAFLGLPNAALLGLQAGFLSFIPYLGPLLGGVAIVLVALSQEVHILAWAVGLYTLIQTVEGYLITPLIQRQAVHLPPLLTLVALILFGAAFGIAGVILATPLAAVLRVFVLRFYIEDTLKRPAEA